MKLCHRCNQSKRDGEFSKDPQNNDGLKNKCKLCNAELVRKYREEHPDVVRETQSRYRKTEHYGVVRRAFLCLYRHTARYRANYDAGMERYKQTTRYKEAHAAHQSTRRAREKSTEHYTTLEWRVLCERYNYICLCCHEKKPLTPDHVIPLSRGGSNAIDNIQCLCLLCNKKKGTQIADYRF